MFCNITYVSNYKNLKIIQSVSGYVKQKIESGQNGLKFWENGFQGCRKQRF